MHEATMDAAPPHERESDGEQGSVRRPARGRSSDRERGAASSEVVAHALLRLACEHPGTMGRLRAARIVGGYAIPEREGGPTRAELAPYAVQLEWTLDELVGVVDALLKGGLLAQTSGMRPVLVVTRAGFRALEALESP